MSLEGGSAHREAGPVRRSVVAEWASGWVAETTTPEIYRAPIPAGPGAAVTLYARALEVRGAGAPDVERARLDLGVPEAVAGAAPHRVSAYVSGRLCAVGALRDAGYTGAGEVPKARGGAPVWPAGFVGSITHTGGLTIAAVATQRQAAGLGIDAERLLATREATRITRVVVPEWAAAPDARAIVRQCEWREAVSVAFSAKESLYKCLAPLFGGPIGFHDVEVAELDRARGVARLRLARGVGGLPRGAELLARFCVADDRVHTFVVLPRLPASPSRPPA